ncbi:MAG: hypothetical protein H6739_09235 [Alphaproteobacteria bacterium]|nr:hypothetical protein [Alphaproteobacteria bacterium]
MLQSLLVSLLSLMIGTFVGASRRSWVWVALPLVAGLPLLIAGVEDGLPLAGAGLFGLSWGLALSLLAVTRWNLRLRPGVALVSAALAMEGGVLTLAGLSRFAPEQGALGAVLVLGAGLACATTALMTGTSKEGLARSGRVRVGTALCALGGAGIWYAQANLHASGAANAEQAANHVLVAGVGVLLVALAAVPPLLGGQSRAWVRRWGFAMAGAGLVAVPLSLGLARAGVESTCADHGHGGPAWCAASARPPACEREYELFSRAEDHLALYDLLPLNRLVEDWGVPRYGVDACFVAFPETRPQPYRVVLKIDPKTGAVREAEALAVWEFGPEEERLTGCLQRVFAATRVPGASCHGVTDMVVSFYGGGAEVEADGEP